MATISADLSGLFWISWRARFPILDHATAGFVASSRTVFVDIHAEHCATILRVSEPSGVHTPLESCSRIPVLSGLASYRLFCQSKTTFAEHLPFHFAGTTAAFANSGNNVSHLHLPGSGRKCSVQFAAFPY